MNPATIPTALDNFKTVVDIIGGLISAGAILAGAIWFWLRRSLAGNLQITMSLRSTMQVNGHSVVVVRVMLKNIGLTKINKDECRVATNPIEANASDAEIVPMPAEVRFVSPLPLFEGLKDLEPGEEDYQDVGFVLPQSGVAFFAVGVEFVAQPHIAKRPSPTWSATTLLHVGEKPDAEETGTDSDQKKTSGLDQILAGIQQLI